MWLERCWGQAVSSAAELAVGGGGGVRNSEELELTGPGSRVAGLGSVAWPNWIGHLLAVSALLVPPRHTDLNARRTLLHANEHVHSKYSRGNSPNRRFCREGPPCSRSFSHNPITPHSLRYPPSSLHSLSKGVVRGWGCPSKVHVLELIQTAGETRSCSDAGRRESGAVNPRCLLVLPVSLSISRPAGQSLRQTCRSPSARGAPTFPTPLL